MKKIALIGAGFIGNIHAQSLVCHPEVDFKYIFDVDSDRAKQLAQQYNVKAVDITTIMESDVDAVLIASSTNTHADICKLAVKYGKGILCEKPIDLQLKKVRTICDIVESSGVPNMVDFNRRFDASHSALKQALMQKKAGNIEIIQITARDQSPPLLEYVKTSGGQMRDQTIHFFDLLCYLSDDYPVEIYVMADALINKEIGAAGDTDTAVISLRMSSGALALIDCSRRSPCGYDERIEVMGSKAMLESKRQMHRHFAQYEGNYVKSDGFYDSWYERIKDTYYNALDMFVHVLYGKKTSVPIPDFKDGLHTQIIAESATKSLRLGRPIKIQY